MTQPPDPGRGDQPGIDLNKPRPDHQQPAQQPAQQPPGGGWGAAAPPPPGSPSGRPSSGGYPPQQPQQGGWQLPPQPGGYPPQPWQGHPGAMGHSRLTPAEERTWAGAAHWSALVAMAVALAFLGPLIVLLVKGNDSPFVRRQAVESLNFQLTILIAGIVSAALIIIVVGLLLLPLVGLAWLVFTIIGAVKASSGEDYRYPLTLRMVR